MRPQRAKQKEPQKEWTAKDVSPDEFKTLWGDHVENYQVNLVAALKKKAEEKELRKKRKEHLVALRSQGLTLSEIGAVIGVTRERARQILAYKEPDRGRGRPRGAKRRIKRKDERFYSIWRGILGRVDKDPYYENIKLCKRWLKYRNFEKDMWSAYMRHVKIYGEYNTTIDRRNVYGDYKPSNCRWATKTVQANNTRRNKVRWDKDFEAKLIDTN